MRGLGFMVDCRWIVLFEKGISLENIITAITFSSYLKTFEKFLLHGYIFLIKNIVLFGIKALLDMRSCEYGRFRESF